MNQEQENKLFEKESREMHAFFKAHRGAWKPSRTFAERLLRALPSPAPKPILSPVAWRWIVAVPVGAIALVLILTATIQQRNANPASAPSLHNELAPLSAPAQENIPQGDTIQDKSIERFSAPSVAAPAPPKGGSSATPSQSQASQHRIVIDVTGIPTRFPKNRVPEVTVPAGAVLHLSVSITPIADIEHARLEFNSFSPDITILTKLPHEIAQLHRGQTVMYDFSLRLPDTAKDVRYPLGVLLIEGSAHGQTVSVGPLDLVVGNPTYLRP